MVERILMNEYKSLQQEKWVTIDVSEFDGHGFLIFLEAFI
jgi:hypothetical protein